MLKIPKRKTQAEIDAETDERIKGLSTGGGSGVYPHRLKKGDSFYAVFPNKDGNLAFAPALYHSGDRQGHLCLDTPPVLKGTKIIKNTPWTSKCPICSANWRRYGDSNKDPELKSEYLSQREREFLVFNVVDLSPFFKVIGDDVVQNKQNMKWIDAYLEIIQQKMQGAEEVSIDPEMPEAVAILAEKGAGLMTVKSYTRAEYGIMLLKAHKASTKSLRSMGMDETEADPVLHPDRFLLHISRKLVAEFETHKDYDTTMSFADVRMEADWEMPEILPEILVDFDNHRDIYDLGANVPESYSLRDKAAMFVPLTEEEVEELYAATGFKLYGKTDGTMTDQDDADVDRSESAQDIPRSQKKGRIGASVLTKAAANRKKRADEVRAATKPGQGESEVPDFDDDDIPF